jgi:phosphoribosyl-ATP pyrophosphohydrolase
MAKKVSPKKAAPKNGPAKRAGPKKASPKKASPKKAGPKRVVVPFSGPLPDAATGDVLDRLWGVVMSRRDADPASSHSARLLSRGTAKVAQKFGEEAVECVIEAVAGNRAALVAESADVLYHLMVLWVNAGLRPDEVWSELERREGISGVTEKASRAQKLAIASGIRTRKIP